MRFLITPELKQNPLLRLLVAFFVAIMLLFTSMDLILSHYQIGLDPNRAVTTLFGNEDAFIEPLLFDILLERIHISLFISIIMLVLLVIIYIRISTKIIYPLIHLTFIAAIIAPLSLLLGYFFGEVFVWIWIFSFILWHLCALYFTIQILWWLL